MGAPSVNIAFIEKSATVIQRGERGVIAMLLKESAVTTADYTFILTFFEGSNVFS